LPPPVVAAPSAAVVAIVCVAFFAGMMLPSILAGSLFSNGLIDQKES
jgi:hypothetical protein